MDGDSSGQCTSHPNGLAGSIADSTSAGPRAWFCNARRALDCAGMRELRAAEALDEVAAPKRWSLKP